MSRGDRRRVWRCLRHVVAGVVVAAILGACSSQADVRSSASTNPVAPTGPPVTVTSSTSASASSPSSAGVAPTTAGSTPATVSTGGAPAANTSAPTVTTGLLPAASAPILGTSAPAPFGSCRQGAPEAGGTITYVQAGQLLSIRPDGSDLRCLVALTPDETGKIAWSSAGDRVLLGPATVADAAGVRPSGYFATNTKVTWSTPTGKAIIAPKATTGQLLWRSSSDQNNRIDVSFLQRTDFAAYHPSGTEIAATGLAKDGVTGVYMATNRGKSPKLLARLETPNSELTELAFSMSGNVLFFLHHHNDTGGYHVHRLQLSDLGLTDVVDEAGTAGHLTVSTVDEEAVAWQVAEPGKALRVEVSAAGYASPIVDVGAGLDVEPVGWLSASRLVVRSVPTGAPSDAAGDLWIITPGAAPVHLATDVSRAAVRIPQGSYQNPPNSGTAQAPG